MLREKEINMCGGEAGWLFNYKVLPRSKRQQLQIFLTWLYNRNLGGGRADRCLFESHGRRNSYVNDYEAGLNLTGRKRQRGNIKNVLKK